MFNQNMWWCHQLTTFLQRYHSSVEARTTYTSMNNWREKDQHIIQKGLEDN